MDIEFEWDEAKRLTNIEKHGIDFEDAVLVFDGRRAVTRASRYEQEARRITTAIVGETFLTVIWTPRDDRIRLISARRSRHAERRAYYAEDRE